MFVVVREPNIEILPVICESLKIVLPSVKELADTELNTTFDVDETSCPIEIVWSTLEPPLNSLHH